MGDVRVDFLFTLFFIGRRIKGEHKKHNEDVMLHMTILHLLYKKECTLSELSKKVYSKLSSLSEKISHMESDGLIKRQQKTDDGREVELRLTPKGVSAARDAEIKMKRYCTALTHSLTDAETKIVTQLLQKLLV